IRLITLHTPCDPILVVLLGAILPNMAKTYKTIQPNPLTQTFPKFSKCLFASLLSLELGITAYRYSYWLTFNLRTAEQ
ncbi:MAG: hypothetical protein V3R93_04660, partial [Candidatus Hydrothermarchaeaceae archaeon]